MNKREFSELVNWLKNRPDEAKRLAAVLEVNTEEKEEGCTWVGVSEAAKHLGKSATWVKLHIELFPSRFKAEQRGRSVWKLKKEELRPMYECYLRQ